MPFETRLRALVNEARSANSSALVVLRDGEVLVDEVFDGRGVRPIATTSVTKAIVSLVVGRAVTLGHLPGPDVKVSEFFPEWRQGRKRDVTLRHLMTHTSGLQNQPSPTAELYPTPDRLQLALCAELDAEPGSAFAYNNKATMLIVGLLERATGQKADAFARAELFGPLGIEDWTWTTDGVGNPHGFADLFLRPADLGKLGQLALDGGDGLISQHWLQESTHSASPVEPAIGLLWWVLSAWTRYSVGPEQIASLRDAGGTAQQIEALKRCQAEDLEREEVIRLITAQGLVPQELPQHADWLHVRRGPAVGFRHDGHRGQHLVVHREARLVAVRMIDWDHPEVAADESAFSTFPDRVLALGGV